MPRSLVDVPVVEWEPEDRKRFCDNYSVAQKWLDGCWAAMETGAKLEAGFVPGYQMVEGSGREKIVNLQAVFDRASRHGVPLEEFLKKSTITKTALAEMTRAASKLKGKGLTAAVEEIIGEDVAVSEVKASLKPI